MTDPHGPEDDQPGGEQDPGGRPAADPVGSVGEEAAKLFGALSDWTRETAPPGSGLGAGLGAGLGDLADHAAATFSEINAHLATGSADCTYCPICRTVHAVRRTSPEVKAHLAGAASSFLQAMVGLLATLPPPEGGRRPGGVERIDLDDPDPDPEDDTP